VAEPEVWAGGFLFSPDGSRVAYALNIPRRLIETRPDAVGVWLMNVESRRHERVLDTEGMEALPVGWSPDGRYLLVSVVLAQGLCDYTIIDTTNVATVPVDDEIRFCGVNGEVAGWTVLD
jgi:Tol biopolymer transport system component